MNEFADDFKEWASKPFSEDMPISHWFLFIGLLIVIALFWNLLLLHLVDALKG
jgi:hypothetical protein